jgi:hypothetical protein
VLRIVQGAVSAVVCSCVVLTTGYVSYCSVERDRLRERERQARAQMSSQAEREAENLGAPFFGPPVRVS